MRLIDADALKETLKGTIRYFDVVADIDAAPTIDSVSRGVHEQVMWERDLAISQLNEIGKSWGEKMDNVATVVRCKDCKHYKFADNRAFGMPVKRCEWTGFEDADDNDFCSRGERSEE